MATDFKAAASRFYGMPITKEILVAREERLTDLKEADLVRAHLMRNYSYFGAIDKTLSGFVVLSDNGDNYYLLDARDTGQVYWQDHDTRDIYIQFDALGDYLGFKKELAASTEAKEADIKKAWTTKKEKKSLKNISTLDLAMRYQWLVWFYAQPQKNQTHFKDFVFGTPGVFENDEAGLATYEKERFFFADDPHLALYWLLHWGAYNDFDKIDDVIASAGAQQPELFQVFADRFSKLRYSQTLEDIIPTFKQRRALFMIYRARRNPGTGASLLVSSFEMDPEYLGFEKLFMLNDCKPNDQQIDELELAISRMKGPDVVLSFAQAMVDKWRGKKESEPAARFTRALMEGIAEREHRSAFTLIQSLLTDPRLVIAGAERVLRENPYHYWVLEPLAVAYRKVGQNESG
jgi:hypothetical protein